MRYICRECKDTPPCILEVPENTEVPTTCPWLGNLFSNKDELDNVEWQELSDSEYFEMRGFAKTQIGEMNMVEGGKFLICDGCTNNHGSSLCVSCISGSNYKSKTDNCCAGCNCDGFLVTDKEQEHCLKWTPAGGSEKQSMNKEETPKRGKILMRALDIINGERQDKYGKPEDSFGLIADYWNDFLASKGVIFDNRIGAKEVAEMMMLFKIARMSGQKPSLDNYLDCIGYAAIAAGMIEEDM